MLSASQASLSSRYRSAFFSAVSTPSFDSFFRSNMATSVGADLVSALLSGPTQGRPLHVNQPLRVQFPPDRAEGIVVRVDDALLERDDRVVGDRDAFGTHLGAALGDVAVPDA